MRLEVS